MSTQSGTMRGLVGALVVLIIVNVAMLTWLTDKARHLGPDEADAVVPRIDITIPAQPPRPLPSDLTSNEQRAIEIFRQASPSVVNITTLSLRRSLRSRDVTAIPAGTGSGCVWDDQGHIVTNHHVVAEGNAARITFADQSSQAATLVGFAPDKDIAVLRVEASKGKLVPLRIGSSSDVLVGQLALAIGDPFGLDHTLSTGVVSGLGREIKARSGRPIFGVIQTDAAINPGNSGGPLLDSGGRLIGINTAIYSPSGASAGIGFAVPVDTVKRIVPQLIEHGRVIRPGLGITFSKALQQRAKVSGILVLEVQPGSAADQAGIRPTTRDPATGALVLGDVIIGIDGQSVKTETDLFKVLDEKRGGDEVEVELRRGDEEIIVTTELTALRD